ncbi:MAG: hypothetical protein KA795_11480 [Burkholderiaceae bacterium]|nr:hypothetical protein [Burkholderiaceae bacterium]
MLIWFKSLFTDMSAGTLLVVLSSSVVLALMFALGEIASRTAESEALPSALPSGARDRAATSLLPSAGAVGDTTPGNGTVSVMVPVGSFN